MPDAFTDTSLIGPQRGLAARAQGAEADHQQPPLALVFDDAVLDDLADRLADRLAARLSAPERQQLRALVQGEQWELERTLDLKESRPTDEAAAE